MKLAALLTTAYTAGIATFLAASYLWLDRHLKTPNHVAPKPTPMPHPSGTMNGQPPRT